MKVKVGIYYYPWYRQGWGNYHWNSSEEYPKWNVADAPLLGYYSCQDENVIRQQLEWMEGIGIDFLIISWWGPNSYEDNVSKTIFSVVKQNNHPIEIAILVEAYNWSGMYDFKTIYGYINDTYILPYEGIYMKLDNLPLICFYNDNINMTRTEENRTAIRSVNGFSARLVGHDSYVDWWFAIPCSVNNLRTPPLSLKDGMICVEPRYDNYYINGTPLARFDVNYAEGLYDDQWNEAIRLAREGEVKYVTIYSWNEYHERSQIEPYISVDGKYVLSPLCKTKSYIDQIKSSEPTSTLLYPLIYIAVGITIGVIPAWAYLVHKMRKVKKGRLDA
jgi:hypothetical protein